MSSLKALIERLRREVLSAAPRVFEEGRCRLALLAFHTDIESVLLALADEREVTYPARDALANALLTMHRTTKTPFWSSVLAIAFFPMLSRLRNRIIGDAVPRDELDQLVLASFWSALAEIPVAGRGSDRLPMRLRQRTQRLVFQSLRQERAQQHESVDDEEHGCYLEHHLGDPSNRVIAEARVELARLLERAAEDGVPQASLEVLAATTLRSELLRTYVARVGPTDEVERDKLYERLKRGRTRTIQRLRGLANGQLLN
jgi:hypothetical protein